MFELNKHKLSAIYKQVQFSLMTELCFERCITLSRNSSLRQGVSLTDRPIIQFTVVLFDEILNTFSLLFLKAVHLTSIWNLIFDLSQTCSDAYTSLISGVTRLCRVVHLRCSSMLLIDGVL